MAVTVADIALDLRLIAAPFEAVPDGQALIIGRHLTTAESLVAERSAGAPEHLQDAATLAIAAYLYDKPSAPGGRQFAEAWSNSGAAALLSRYIRRQARAIGSGPAVEGAAGPGTGPGVDQVARDDIETLQAGLLAIREVSRRGDNPIEAYNIASIEDYNRQLNLLWGLPDFPRLLHITGAFSVTAEGETFNLGAGDIVLLAPRPEVPGLVDFDPNDPATVPAPHLIHRAGGGSTPAYTLPAAAPGVRGGVQAVTNAIIDTGTSSGIFGWGLSHVRRVATAVVESIVPAWARAADPPASSGGDGGGRVLGTYDEGARTEAQIAAALNDLFEGDRAGEGAAAGDLVISYQLDSGRNASIVHVRQYRIQKPGGTTWPMAERWPVVVAWTPGDELPAYEQVETRGLLSRAGALFWEALNLVPNTPGEASGVGSILAVTGENDSDFAWRKASQILPLATGGGLEFDGSGKLKTTPSLVAAAAEADAAVAGLDLQAVAVATAQSYQNTLNSQRTATGALILHITAAIRGSRNSQAYSWPAGQVLWFPPKSDAGEPVFILPQGALGAADRAKLAGVTRNDETAATNAADVALGERIDALATVADPTFSPDFWVKDGAARTVDVRLDPRAIVAGDAKVRLILHGANVGTVALQEGRHTYGFDVSAANAGTITRAAGNAGESNVPATVELLGAGDVVTRRQHGMLRVEESAPAPAGGIGFTTIFDDVAGTSATASSVPGVTWTITDAAVVAPIKAAAAAGNALLVTLIADSADGTSRHTWSAWWLPQGAGDGATLHFGDLAFQDGDSKLGFEILVRTDRDIVVARPKPFGFWNPVLVAAGQTAGRNEAKAAAHKLRISQLGAAS